MKIPLFLLLLVFITSQYAVCKQAGWVPIPPTPSTNIGKPAKKASRMPAKMRPKNHSLPETGATVYDRQPPVTEAEILSFVRLLPQFRAWAIQQGEEAHPIVAADGQPDFTYSSRASTWLQSHNFNSRRFFCIMGRMAAGMVIVEEGNDFRGTRPKDMPEVSEEELELVRRHMGELLNAGKSVPPVKVN